MIEVHIRHGQASAETAWGLTEEGKRQAEAAAAYLQSDFPRGFDIGVHSGSRRVIETVKVLGLINVDWVTDRRLREADWKGNAAPREFARWEEMYGRVGAACSDLDVRDRNLNRITVSHGGTMQMIRAYREGLIGSRFPLLFEEHTNTLRMARSSSIQTKILVVMSSISISYGSNQYALGVKVVLVTTGCR